jgi:colanic acid biosynthesis glycosyl transferase WcaI
MKVNIHTMYFLPEFGSAPILMNELATYLAERGHETEVITTIPRLPDNLKYKKRFCIKESNNGFRIKRYWTNMTSTPIGRFIAWNIYTLWTIFNVFNIRKGDVLFLRLPPLQLGLTGFMAQRIKGAKVLLSVQDIHPDLAIESGILRNPLAMRLAKALEKWVYKKSEEIVVISEGFKENLLNKDVNPQKLKVIPNWVDTDFLSPLPKDNPVAQEFSLADKFVVMYSGTITLSSYLTLERILEAATRLKNDRDIIFAIVGEGMKKQSLEEKADQLGLKNVRFLPFQPYEDLPYLLASSDVLLVPLDKEKSDLSVPSKLYNFMAAGRPILGLADDSSEVARIISETNCGMSVNPEDVKGIAETIQSLKNSKSRCAELGAYGRKHAVENFAKNKVLKMYEDTMSSL